MACRRRMLRYLANGETFHVPGQCDQPQDRFRADQYIESHEDMEVSERDSDGWNKWEGGRGCRMRGDTIVHTRE